MLHATPKLRYSTSIFEATIPYDDSPRGSSVTGHVFDDANNNGVRDEGEPPVAQQGIYVSQQEPICFNGNGSETSGLTDENGDFILNNVPVGRYVVQLGGEKLPATPDPNTITIPGWPQDFTFDVRDKPVTVALPLRVEQGATITVFVFDDANQDGVQSTGENPVPNYAICARDSNFEPNQNAHYYFQYHQACGQTDRDGIALLRPLISGQYDIPAESGYSTVVPLRALPAARQVTLSEGEQLAVYLPLDVIPAAEQVIAPGAGTPVVFETCFPDPAWVQCPFEEGFASAFPYGGPPEDQVRDIYEQGIYTANSSDIGLWASIAGQSDWLALIPGCSAGPRDFGPQARLLVFVNYEPTAIVWSGNVVQGTPVAVPAVPGSPVSSSNVLQFTLRRNNGLYAVLVHSSEQERYNVPWYLFVDEDSNPIERRSAYGDSYGYPGGR